VTSRTVKIWPVKSRGDAVQDDSAAMKGAAVKGAAVKGAGDAVIDPGNAA
jgi:hypothetical protein